MRSVVKSEARLSVGQFCDLAGPPTTVYFRWNGSLASVLRKYIVIVSRSEAPLLLRS